MKNLKTVMALSLVATTVLATGAISFADSKYNSPVEAAAGLTGKNIEEVRDAKKSGQHLSLIVDEDGKLVEFQRETLEQKKERIQAKLESGQITLEQAAQMLENIELNHKNCEFDGSKERTLVLQDGSERKILRLKNGNFEGQNSNGPKYGTDNGPTLKQGLGFQETRISE